MALGSTIRKLTLSVADMDRDYYDSHVLTVAQHPSETDERVMLRILIFALFASPVLEFGRGVSTDDEPDIWQRDLTGRIERWIDLGMPDEKRIRKACGRADKVVLVTYGGSKADVWLKRQGPDLVRFANLLVMNVADAPVRELAGLIGRNMQLNATIQDGQVMLSSDAASVSIEPVIVQGG